jgi:hypothetical protein
MFVGVDIGNAHVGVGGSHSGEECKMQFDARKDGRAMVAVVMTVVVEVLDEFARLFVHVEIQPALLIPRYLHIKVWERGFTLNADTVECSDPFDR